jgi:hypothetical protein
MPIRPYLYCLFVFLFSFSSFSQETNTTVVAEIKTQSLAEFVKVDATANSKTELIKPIRYVLYVYREDVDGNVKRAESSNNVVLQPNAQLTIASEIFNRNETDQITFVLLLYDDKDKLIGRDRKVVLNDKEAEQKTEEVVKSEDDIYAGLLRGIITEDTKTKPGRDFYIEFSSLYRLQQINGIEVVKVFERFSFGRSTIMEVQVGNTVVHRFFTQPRREFLQEQAKIAIVGVSRYFANLERNKNYVRRY